MFTDEYQKPSRQRKDNKKKEWQRKQNRERAKERWN